MTCQVNRNADGNLLSLVHLVEVCVQQSLSSGVKLQLLYNSLVGRAVNGNVHYIDVRCIDGLTKIGKRYLERQCLRQAVLASFLTIKIAGNESLLAQKLGSLLAGCGTLLTANVDFFHNL